MSMRAIPLMCASLAAALSATALAERVASPLRPLLNAAIAYSKDTKKDEFSSPPGAEKHVGSEVSLTIPLNSSSSSVSINYLSSGFYKYNQGELKSYLHHWFGPLDIFEPATVLPGRAYRGSNAFGVAVNIRVETIQKVGVSVVNIPDPSQLRRSPNRSKDFSAFEHVISAEGAEARRLSNSLRYEVLGKISRFSDGKSVRCRSGQGKPPTRENPKDFTYHFCTLAIEANKITLKDGQKVVRSWEREEIENHNL